MRLEITNASYSTALTYELVTQYGFQILGAPTFPSLQEEAFYRADSNKPTIPIFIQYKLGEYFIGNTSSLKDIWGVPYYRFPIQPKNNDRKHQLLLNLEAMDQLVFYTAPDFHTLNEFFSHLMQRALLDKSTFCSPREIGALSEGERFSLSYKREASYGLLQPGDRKVEKLVKGELLLNVIKQKFDTGQAKTYNDEMLLYLGDMMLENYLKIFYTPKQRALNEDIQQGRERIDPRDYLSLIAILLYDCFVYMISMP